MRKSRPILCLFFFAALGACAGNVADHIGPRDGIVGPELTRYGLAREQADCVNARLVAGLTPLQLRRLQRSASAVTNGYHEPGRLVFRDLMHVASSLDDPQIRLELARASEGCGVGTTEASAEPAVPAAPVPTVGAPRPPSWLNLGAAPTGQAIAVDAASLEQEENRRKAWFRLSNPNAPAPTDVSYLLRIDCTARTIEPLAHRRQSETGEISEHAEYAPDPQGPMPIEGGTVMEIAFLSLCT